MIKIPTNVLAAVAKWASTDESRPHICMVLFTAGEYVACDGHRLVRMPLEYDGTPFGVDRGHLLAAVAAQRSMQDLVADEDGEVEFADSNIEIKLDGARVVLAIADGVRMAVPTRDASNYPPIEQVMPKERPSTLPDPYGFNPRYLGAIHEIQAALTPNVGDQGVKIAAWGGQLDAMLFTGFGGVRFVIMPVRT